MVSLEQAFFSWLPSSQSGEVHSISWLPSSQSEAAGVGWDEVGELYRDRLEWGGMRWGSCIEIDWRCTHCLLLVIRLNRTTVAVNRVLHVVM